MGDTAARVSGQDDWTRMRSCANSNLVDRLRSLWVRAWRPSASIHLRIAPRCAASLPKAPPALCHDKVTAEPSQTRRHIYAMRKAMVGRFHQGRAGCAAATRGSSSDVRSDNARECIMAMQYSSAVVACDTRHVQFMYSSIYVPLSANAGTQTWGWAWAIPGM